MNAIEEWLKVIGAAIAAVAAWRTLRVQKLSSPDPPNPEKTSIRKFMRFLRRKRRPIFGWALIFVAVGLVGWRIWPEPRLDQLSREELLTKAWKYHDKQNWRVVLRYTEWIVEKHTGPAETALKEWQKMGKEPPTTGVVIEGQLTAEDERRNHQYGAVNDIATAHYLMGIAHRALQDNASAKNDFEAVKKYTNAVTYNRKTKEFWRTVDGADSELSQMEKKVKP